MEQLLKEAVGLIVGKQSEVLVNLLNSKNHINEFIIAKKLDTTINHARNLLYKLSEFNLVSSIRKKDKKKGWYTYFWRLEQEKILFFLREVLSKKIVEISDEIQKRTSGRYYFCETCKIELEEDKALLNDFTCNECGQIFSAKDNSKDLKELVKLKEKYSKELELVKEKIEEESVKFSKKKEKDAQKLLKQKKEARAKKRALSKDTKKKINSSKTKKKK